MPTTIRPEQIVTHFRLSHSATGDSGNFITFLETHLHFVTMTFGYARTRVSSFKWQLQQFGKLHFQLAKQTLGNNLRRKREYQPLSYAFIDFAGSRSRKLFLNGVLPHIHALILGRGRDAECLREAIAATTLTSIGPSVENIKIVPFDNRISNPLDLTSYCMKGYLQTPANFEGKEDLWEVFPS